jgi:hypothetical protein
MSGKLKQSKFVKKSIAVALMSLGFAWFCPGAQAQQASVPSAPEIMAKLAAKYAGLTNLAVTGRVIEDIDMSGGKTPAAAPKTDELKYDLGKPGRVIIFNIRLAKPDLYRIEWSQRMSDSYTQKGAVWSSGSGDFLLLADRKQRIKGGMEMALASATGVSGGVASTLPPIFFQRQTNELQSLAHLTLQPEEKIGDDACYVVSGDLNGQKLILWITKDYWLKQKKMVLGTEMKMPEMSDEDIKKALSSIGQAATQEAVDNMRKTMKSAQAMSSKMKGSITEKYETFKANSSVAKESFDYESESKSKTGN